MLQLGRGGEVEERRGGGEGRVRKATGTKDAGAQSTHKKTQKSDCGDLIRG
jgi:hypothetical protein